MKNDKIKNLLQIYINQNLTDNLSVQEKEMDYAYISEIDSKKTFSFNDNQDDTDINYSSQPKMNFFNQKFSKKLNIDDYLNNHSKENNFQELLFKYIDERHLKDSDVYNKVHLDRRLFSKIRSDSNYHPSKETIILLGLSLELTENELTNLLESASYSLPKNNYYDLIIRFCFINNIYKLSEVNELLYEYNCKLLNN